MREVKHYICEYCNTEYAEKNIAEICERQHKEAKEIVEQIYVPMKNNETGYPNKIRVKMSDGKYEWFKRLKDYGSE